MSKSKIWKLLRDIVILGGVIFVVSSWQARKMATEGDMIHKSLSLTTLDGSPFQLSQLKGKKVMVYFFAPWCGVCDVTTGSVQNVHDLFAGDDMAVVAVGLSYKNQDQLANYAEDHELTAPILIGKKNIMEDLQIDSFPSFYFLDESGEVSFKTIGYSPIVTMVLRLFAS